MNREADEDVRGPSVVRGPGGSPLDRAVFSQSSYTNPPSGASVENVEISRHSPALMRIPVIAIVGRPNVGKSTLFNAIVGERRAIVEDVAGITRDRNYAFVERLELPFSLVDTGGYDRTTEGVIETQVRNQTLMAIEEADALVVMFDGKAGAQPGDEEVVEIIRKARTPVIYCVNKCDGLEQQSRVNDFYSLGVGDLFDVSALHGRNTKLLIKQMLQLLPDYEELKQAHVERRAAITEVEESAAPAEAAEAIELEELNATDPGLDYDSARDEMRSARTTSFAPVFIPGETAQTAAEYEKQHRLAEVMALPKSEEDEIWAAEALTDPSEGPTVLDIVRVAIVGRPNVGKSTMLNTLLGETRAITSPVAGTTRDALDVRFEFDNQVYLLTDTAGLRRQGRITDDIERYATMRSLRAISDADVAVLMIDATEGPTDQDMKIAGVVHDQGKGLLIAINKWDAVEKDHRTAHEFKENMRVSFKFAPYAPLIYTSALSGRRCVKILPEALKIALARQRRIPTGRLNRSLQRSLRKVSAPSYHGTPVKLYYANQVDVAPPRFALFFNHPRGIHFSYLRFIKNAIRETYPFEGSDIKLMARKQ